MSAAPIRDVPISDVHARRSFSRRPYAQAVAFSLETLTTIGYGIPNGGDFFEDSCVLVLLAVYLEAMIFVLLNASVSLPV